MSRSAFRLANCSLCAQPHDVLLPERKFVPVYNPKAPQEHTHSHMQGVDAFRTTRNRPKTCPVMSINLMRSTKYRKKLVAQRV